MIRNFNFDYDYENDDLFMYDPKSKSKASVEMDDFIIDYNSKKQIAGIELINASEFLSDLDCSMTKDALKEITDCKVEIIPKNNFYLLKFMLQFKTKTMTTPVLVPNIKEPSPAL